jgi:hypothetical protein
MSETIEQLAASIRAHIEMGDEANLTADLSMDEAEQHYKAAGLCLKALKKQKPKAVSWENFVKSYCGISRARADELIRIADGKDTLEQVRGDNAERNRRYRERRAAEALSRDSGQGELEADAAPQAGEGTSDSGPAEPGTPLVPPAGPDPVPPAPADERPPEPGAAPPKPREAEILEQFAAAMRELIRLAAKPAAAFINTSIPVLDLELVSNTLAQIAKAIRNSEKEEKEAA